MGEYVGVGRGFDCVGVGGGLFDSCLGTVGEKRQGISHKRQTQREKASTSINYTNLVRAQRHI